MLTPEKLKEIEERCNKATPGPWAWEIDRNDNFDGNNPYELWATHAMSLGINSPVAVGIGVVSEYQPEDDSDLKFIAAARQDIPLLIEEIRRLNQYIEKIDSFVPCWAKEL